MQKGMLFHAISAPEGGAYVVQTVLDLVDVDEGRLRRCFEDLVHLHATLRSCFEWEEVDTPVQVVFDPNQIINPLFTAPPQSILRIKNLQLYKR